MTDSVKVNWAAVAVIFTIVTTIGGALWHFRKDYLDDQKTKSEQAILRAVQVKEREIYRNYMETRVQILEARCSFYAMDSIKDALNELEIKNHLKPKF